METEHSANVDLKKSERWASDYKIEFDKKKTKFEGDHPVVHGQLFIVSVPSLHNI